VILKRAIAIRKNKFVMIPTFLIPMNILGHMVWHGMDKQEKKQYMVVKTFKKKGP
jgi:hypothetical protein